MTSPSVSFKRSAVRSGTKGKGCDTFGPVGPWLVTRDEVIDRSTILRMLASPR